MQPEISVILPLYNAEGYIKEAIDSLLIQTFTNFELIIINDGSTDNSKNIISDSRSVVSSAISPDTITELGEGKDFFSDDKKNM